MVKTTGAEFWKFYEDEEFWPNGAWHDDTLLMVDGEEVTDYDKENIPMNSKVTLDGGIVFLGDSDDEGLSFESHFRKWKKTQTHVFLSVECHRDDLEKVKAAVKEAGGKVK